MAFEGNNRRKEQQTVPITAEFRNVPRLEMDPGLSEGEAFPNQKPPFPGTAP